jgi:thioesterase domain-containing protein/acyl carrier protein
MVPAAMVVMERLPVTANGKVDRKRLPAAEVGAGAGERVGPRNELEGMIAGIWREVLKVETVGVDDNFFELGGHSLLLVRMLALIEKRLRIKLSLTAAFQKPTIKDLATILNQHIMPGTESVWARQPGEAKRPLLVRPGSKRSLTPVFGGTMAEYLAGVFRQSVAPGPQSSLVAIQPGGSKRPLFLVHPGGGHVYSYIRLAQFLGPDQPCYGFQARGLEYDPHTRIEDMAAYYIQGLQMVQPMGPYLLGGWCMGGVVAFEMAQQLRARGQRMALLALLESPISTSVGQLPVDDAGEIRHFFGTSFDPMASLAQIPEDQDQQLAFMLEQAKKAGIVPAEIDLPQARHFVELIRSNRRATQNYRPRLYPGQVILFRAREAPRGRDPTLGWSEWAGGGVKVYVVPGKHDTLVHKPHGKLLARRLIACINQVQSGEALASNTEASIPAFRPLTNPCCCKARRTRTKTAS